MAANLIPCPSKRCLAFCSCTSCALQNGHQSAERKKRSTTPREPFRVSLDRSCPNWSWATKGGIFCPALDPVKGETSFGEEDLSDPHPNANRQKENIRAFRLLFFNSHYLRPSDWRYLGAS